MLQNRAVKSMSMPSMTLLYSIPHWTRVVPAVGGDTSESVS